jgi:hypothetical protein
MKQIRVESDWLGDIDGMTVAQAIEHLKTLPQDHKLDYYMDGPDTWGCSIESNLIKEIPYTEEEIAQMKTERKMKQIQDCKRSIEYYQAKLDKYLKTGEQSWISNFQSLLSQQQAKLKELEA